ncbi:hypothetical protein [Altibacter sp.]|uniref:hypothetical protein n=1 Tax=Altibacter sp. TaxID=2024823 RepID=UPI002589C3A2|nr:hypothetical protein [Altibacter sp.]MCW9037551.1 hypothetical protein [Altibacter sp.]
MFPKTNIEKQLKRSRNRRITSEEILAEVHAILLENKILRSGIETRLQSKPSPENIPFSIDMELLETQRIYQLQDIKKICVDYRLRFLDAHYFKGAFPSEAISAIRAFEKNHNTQLQHFKIMAPSKLLKLENADDPLLFVPLGNDYFYLLHAWGNDLHPFRKFLMWPYKSFENLVFTIFILSIFLTAITPLHLFTPVVTPQEYLLMFLFMFKAVGGIVLFYGFAKGKNFNNAIWDSKFYNA